MDRYKELCNYCFNQRELENADLELVGCPICSAVVSSYVDKDPIKLAEKAIKEVFKDWKKYE